MRSERKLSDVAWQRRTEPGELPEWMDEPCTLDELRACLGDLRQVNRITLGYRPTLQFLDKLIAMGKWSARVRVLDVGFGGGDALHRIATWAHAQSVPVLLTGIDFNPLSTYVAKEQYRDDTIEWLTGDALAHAGESDIIVSSLLTHHLAIDDVVRFIRWMERTATLGWFVNDLERSARSASLFKMLSHVMRWHPFVMHDGPVSFARSFVREDWRHILTEADVPLDAVQIANSFPARLCVSRLK